MCVGDRFAARRRDAREGKGGGAGAPIPHHERRGQGEANLSGRGGNVEGGGPGVKVECGGKQILSDPLIHKLYEI
jgi:hypothetical protein